MDQEKQIAETIAQNVPRPEPQASTILPEPEAPQDTSHNNLPIDGFQAKNELMQFFNIQPSAWNAASNQETITAIYQWASQNADSPDLAGILRAINHAETMLGSRLKSDRLNRLYNFVRIQGQRALLAEKERALYT